MVRFFNHHPRLSACGFGSRVSGSVHLEMALVLFYSSQLYHISRRDFGDGSVVVVVHDLCGDVREQRMIFGHGQAS